MHLEGRPAKRNVRITVGGLLSGRVGWVRQREVAVYPLANAAPDERAGHPEEPPTSTESIYFLVFLIKATAVAAKRLPSSS
jgi:hypothetical protein